MDNLFFPFDLSDFPTVDKEKRRDEIIEATKALNKMIKDSRNQAKQSNCYYCGNDCDSFCNSHTLPAFCLRNIAQNGKVFYSNTILDLPLLKDDNGVNEAGTFHLICRDCDSKVFQDYENPDNYKDIPSIKMNMSLCIFPLKTTSIIMMFVSKDNNRYGRFFKQLKKLGNLNEQLSVINYILFSYSEDYFLSSNIPQNILKELVALSGKTPELLTLTPPSPERILEAAKEIFDFRDRQNIPNLLSSQFALNNE